MFYKRGVFENFAKIHRKTSVSDFFFNKAAGLAPATLLQRDSDTGVKFLRTPFL